MADEDELKERIKEILAEKDGEAAIELLTDDNAYSIGKNERNRLALVAIKEAYIAPHFTKIAGLVSGEVLKKLSEDLGRHGEAGMIFAVLEDPEYRNQRDIIVSAALSNDEVELGALYALAIGSASNEIKEKLNTAVGRKVDIPTEDLAAVLGDPQFSAHQSAILRHIEARMGADELEEFLDEVRGSLSPNEIDRLEKSVERKRKYG